MKYIDIEKGISDSNSRFLKSLPGFIISLLKKIVHEDEMNYILNKYKDCQGVDFHNSVIKEMNLTLEVDGIENLPSHSNCFFVSNHPFGVLDGLVLTKTILDKYGDFRGIGNEAFQYIPNLKPYIAIVNAYGHSPKHYVVELEKLYSSDFAITHFPAGEVSRHYKGKIQDRDWMKSFITKAVSCQRDVVPFYFKGRNSNLFYSINLIRRALGIKLNIELMLLPSEFFKKRNSTVKVKIGKPIPWQTFDSTHSQIEWAQKVKEQVYSLRKN